MLSVTPNAFDNLSTSNMAQFGSLLSYAFEGSIESLPRTDAMMESSFSNYGLHLLNEQKQDTNGEHGTESIISLSPPMIPSDCLDAPGSPSTLPDLAFSCSSRESTIDMPGNSKPLQQTDARKTRSSRSPRKRKIHQSKADKPGIPVLTAPLSELTVQYHHIPIRDMEQWAHRSAEVRWKEVEKREGYVARPMNSFMLYRSAYAERTKFWCLQNNHQVVSSVSGASWPLEPPSIRDYYNELARIERINHQAAHPGYKFSPSKTPATKKRKFARGKSASVEEDFLNDDTSSLTYGSMEQEPPRRCVSNPIQKSWMYLGSSYNTAIGGPELSTFDYSNPGLDSPRHISPADLSGQYYQTTIQQRRTNQHPYPAVSPPVEDVFLRPAQGPSSSNVFAFAIDPRLESINTKRDMDQFEECSFSERTENPAKKARYSSEYTHDRPSSADTDAPIDCNSNYEFPPYCPEKVQSLMYRPHLEHACLLAKEATEQINYDNILDMDLDCSFWSTDEDVRKLSGYNPLMEGYINAETWTGATSGADFIDGVLSYEEWLE
ncbi:hypothetical protein EX30DRAFT_258356 [Ascodesmis nigricans]|uniref:HMG box domain-containing protein n=1 Tax=Ascodesmis nigricans TaxID=341454 RepID=A0A4S2MHP7_9PEZI|nr:hypothetical protein EX30DRAFT_258356 [Ascodesmis nigricans]